MIPSCITNYAILYYHCSINTIENASILMTSRAISPFIRMDSAQNVLVLAAYIWHILDWRL